MGIQTWLRRHGWWVLFAVSAILVAFGITDIALGASADPGIAQGLTGKTLDELQAESADAFAMYDFATRTQGSSLVLLGLLTGAIVLIPFRRGERWAWWIAWTLPVWAVAVAAFYLFAGVEADQPPPPPLVSGPIVAGLCAIILIATVPRTSGIDDDRP